MKCSVCGKEIETDFNFCPWCGCDVEENQPFVQILDDSFQAIEEVVHEDTIHRLENLSSRLSSMEDELNSFLLTSK